jgi:hypothetical protein
MDIVYLRRVTRRATLNGPKGSRGRGQGRSDALGHAHDPGILLVWEELTARDGGARAST